MIILGIESTHDDTSISILEDNKVILNFKISQEEIHSKFGGTVPELASREHVNNFNYLIEKLINNFDIGKIEKVAYASEPGLIGSLQMGYLVASAISGFLKVELVPINHLHGHIYSNLIKLENETNKEFVFPSLALVVSGGHSQIYILKSFNEIELISSTIDDAIGEAFDKVARVLKLGFPGGHLIDKIYSKNKDRELIPFTKPKTEKELDFSFSGIKTQVSNYVNNNKEIDVDIVATSFQKTSVDYVIEKFTKAIKIYKPKSISLSGGVSANNYLRELFLGLHKNVFIPNKEFTSDNAAMIACAAYFMKFKLNKDN